MKFPKVQIDEIIFYKVGKYVFLIMAVMNLAGLIDGFGTLKGVDVLSKLAMICFHFALMGFFGYLLGKFEKKEATDQDAEDLAKEVGELFGKEVMEIKEGKNVKKIKGNKKKK